MDLNTPYVWIQFAPDSLGGMFVCGDEDGEFARASHPETIMAYAEHLVVGPGTIREGGLKEATT